MSSFLSTIGMSGRYNSATSPSIHTNGVPPIPAPSQVSKSIQTQLTDDPEEAVPKRRGQIFEQDAEGSSTDISSLIRDHSLMEPETQGLLKEAMGRFIGLGETTNLETAFELVLRGMDREVFEKGSNLIKQGDKGSKLYVIEKGEVEISIDGRHIRTMGVGDVIGELALLYDAPRSATVTNISDTVLWSLRREIFKQINAVSSSALYTQRSEWLAASHHLACLNAIELPRLIATLRIQHFAAGGNLYTEAESTDKVILIESGSAFIYTKTDNRHLSPGNIDKLLGIVRPKRKRTSVRSMNVTELSSYLSKTKMESIYEEESGSESGEYTPMVSSNMGVLHIAGVSHYFACEVYEGCVLGIGALLSKGSFSGGWSCNAECTGAHPPYTITAHTQTTGLVFTVPVFERLFGKVENVIRVEQQTPRDTPRKNTLDLTTEKKFDPSKFDLKYVLGNGGFGTVVFAELKEGSTVQGYALKILNKSDIIETGQVKHVCDERRLLALMNNRFILKLFGTYQNVNQIVIVTEAINNGDMWSVIYELPFERSGLPRQLVCFYIASIVIALSHIHERGLAYRDLKPENIMLDNKGYIRVIDFGFCKAIPFTKIDANGDIKVHAKSHTLCGTPEYLAPEIVFKLGHDFSVDLWALGVTLYEMFMGATPFAPKKAENIEEFYKKLATAKRKGVELSGRLDDKASTQLARLLALKLLAPEPSDRLGVKEGNTACILEDAFFSDLNIEALKAGTLVPVYIPVPSTQRQPLTLLTAKPYEGDQELFASF